MAILRSSTRKERPSCESLRKSGLLATTTTSLPTTAEVCPKPNQMTLTNHTCRASFDFSAFLTVRYSTLCFFVATLLLQPRTAEAQSFWSSYGTPGQSQQQQQQQQSQLNNYAPYMSSGAGAAESFSPYPPYNFYGDPSAAAMMSPRSGGSGTATVSPYMYGSGASSAAQQPAANYNPYMQVQSNPYFPMLDALKMPGTTCYCELRENKLGVPGELFDTLVYPALQNTECLLAGPECNTACEAQARKQYDIPTVVTEEGVLNKQNKDGVSLGSRICSSYNKAIPTPGVKIAVFAKAETCPKAGVVVELLGGEELKFCCLYGAHPFILTEKILLYSPECMGDVTASGLPVEPPPAAAAAPAAGAAAAAGTPPATASSLNPFLAKYNENSNPFSPASLFNPFAGLPGMGPQAYGAQQPASNPLSTMMAMFGGNGAAKPNNNLGTAGVMTGSSSGLGLHQQNPLSMSMPFYPMSAPMTMPVQSSHQYNSPGAVQMMPYKAAPQSPASSPMNAPG